MDDSDKKIKDLPTFIKLKEKFEGVGILVEMHHLLRQAGFVNDSLSEIAAQLPAQVTKMEKLLYLLDRFNEVFSCRGWIAYESLDVEIMERALTAAKEANMEEAEQLLADYYDNNKLHYMLVMMRGLEEYLVRDSLAQQAKEDYLAGRYHSCIPVILSMIDGMMNDIVGINFFAARGEVTAWDSIVGHDSGLTIIRSLFSESRNVTTAEKITIPYRHGIMHGRDVGYANKAVAAKAWATLFALRDWAVARKKSKDVLGKNRASTLPNPQENTEESADLSTDRIIASASWSPRTKVEIEKIINNQKSEAYSPGSPELRVDYFMQCWSKSNYGFMANCLSKLMNNMGNRDAARLRNKFQNCKLIGYSIINIEDKNPNTTVIETKINYVNAATQQEYTVNSNIVVIYETNKGDLVCSGDADGEWRVFEGSFMNIT